jgi:hypothetical protein
MSAPPATAAEASSPPQSLDDVMLAMDVVDTIRHNELIVERELSEGQREEALRKRLREIYSGQGLEVSDRVIDEGIKALRESRFVYTPSPPSLNRTLAEFWVDRARIGKWFGIVAGGVLLLWGAYQFGVVAPRERAEQSARVELSETLPKSLQAAYDGVMSEARVDAAVSEASTLLNDGKAALGHGDTVNARKAVAALEALRGKLVQTYELRIVSREGQDTGVWRVPDVNTQARNYYIVVEAIDADGRTLTVPVTNEENGKIQEVSIWGVRVPEDVFDAVRADKSDDGIVQNRRMGRKLRGELEIRYEMRVLGGAITSW